MCDKIIHLFVLKELNEVENRCIRSIHSHNKNYVLIYHTSSDFIPEELNFPNSQKNITNNINEYNLPYYKTLISYHYGGLILDTNMLCFQSFDIILSTFNSHEDKKLVVFKGDEKYQNKDNFLSGILISKPKNNILQNCIDNKIDIFHKLDDKILNECIILPYQIFIQMEMSKISSLSEKELRSMIKHSICVKLKSYEEPSILENLFSLSENPFYETNFEEKIYYINLKSRPERNIFFLSTWNRIFKNIIRFDACIHQKIGPFFINGCGRSHFEISEIVLNKKNEDYVMVLEDDAYPTDNFMEFYPKVIEYVKNNTSNFELLSFGSPTVMEQKNKLFNPKIINENILQVDATWSGHFNIYTKGILYYFYKFWTQTLFKTTIHFDQDSYFREELNLRKIISYPLLSYQEVATFISDTRNIYRFGDYYSKCEEQLKFAVQKRKEGVEGNLFDITPKEIHHH